DDFLPLPFGFLEGAKSFSEFTHGLEGEEAIDDADDSYETDKVDIFVLMGQFDNVEASLPVLASFEYCTLFVLDNRYYAHIKCDKSNKGVVESRLLEYGVLAKRTPEYLMEYGILVGSAGQSAKILSEHFTKEEN